MDVEDVEVAAEGGTMFSKLPTILGCPDQQYIPKRLLLQWHVTQRCNLRCAHCYQESYAGKELTFPELLGILGQFEELLESWNQESGAPRTGGHITVTGGEPFMRPDFMELLEVFTKKRELFSFAILTNGCTIDGEVARRLGRLRPRFVQVSIEGTEATHDRIRGRGNYHRTITALRHLRREKIPTAISFTAHRENFREFLEVARLGQELRVDRVWADRLIPTGSGELLRKEILTEEETREFFEVMAEARREATKSWFGGTEIAMHRALQFLVAGGRAYHCTAGDTLLTVMPNGDLYPCRRMPIRVGDLMETPLRELYYGSRVLLKLRDENRVSSGCEQCNFRHRCRGGLRCLSYALRGDPFRADPDCWLADKQTFC